VIVVAGLDPEEEVPILHLRLRKAWRNHTAKIVVVGPTSARSTSWRGATCVHRAGRGGAALRALPTTASRTLGEALHATAAPAVLVGERAGAGAITGAAALAATSVGSASPTSPAAPAPAVRSRPG
jgi:NADH-quinone oxidoreductase subunit G